MSRRLGIWKWAGFFTIIILPMLIVQYLEVTAQNNTEDIQANSETLIAKFIDGIYAVTSDHEYSGTVTITVSEIGQASGTQYGDAFYLLTDYSGNPITPYHPTDTYNWLLFINGQHAETFIAGQLVPDYQADHTYTFEINAPGGQLTFGVGDLYTIDNVGSYIITINAQESCDIPYFSQIDPSWKDHPLRTTGVCSASCNTIGTCGCTLTSAAMLFAYYGTNTNPPTLSDCMGAYACPFYWSTGAACSGGKATYINRYSFSWNRLDQEINQSGRPVLLEMHKGYNTHWVLVTNGQGNSANNYLIHDPGTLAGANTSLAVYERLNYTFVSLVAYNGVPTCSNASTLEERNSSIQTTYPTESENIVKPISQELNSFLENGVSGSIVIYRLMETTAIVQLSATSTAGEVTEMELWTDANASTGWQPYETLAWLPWEPDDNLNVQFRDDQGNVSEVYSTTLAPANSPPPSIELFLPLIVKSP